MKKELRKEVLSFLYEYKENKEKKQREEKVILRFLQSSCYKQANTIGAFIPSSHEFQLELLFQHIYQDQKNLVCPRAKNHQLTFYPLTPTTKIERSSFGIKEPEKSREIIKESIDVLIVPGIVFNKKGYRIGYGGGYYDRFLKDYGGHTHSFFLNEQQKKFSPEPFDCPIQTLWMG